MGGQTIAIRRPVGVRERSLLPAVRKSGQEKSQGGRQGLRGADGDVLEEAGEGARERPESTGAEEPGGCGQEETWGAAEEAGGREGPGGRRPRGGADLGFETRVSCVHCGRQRTGRRGRLAAVVANTVTDSSPPSRLTQWQGPRDSCDIHSPASLAVLPAVLRPRLAGGDPAAKSPAAANEVGAARAIFSGRSSGRLIASPPGCHGNAAPGQAGRGHPLRPRGGLRAAPEPRAVPGSSRSRARVAALAAAVRGVALGPIPGQEGLGRRLWPRGLGTPRGQLRGPRVAASRDTPRESWQVGGD